MSNARYFVDLSSNNAQDGAASFDAAVYAAAGHRLVAIKVSEGTGYVNPFWRGWATAARDAGLSLILYHFANGNGASAQAKFFTDQITGWGRFLPGFDRVFLDIEQGSAVAIPASFRSVFEAAVEASGFRDLGVYSDAGYFEQYGTGLRPSGGDLWVAAYPTIPAGWWAKDWAHQYTQGGTVRGVTGPVDLSVLSHTFTWLKYRFLHPPRRP